MLRAALQLLLLFPRRPHNIFSLFTPVCGPYLKIQYYLVLLAGTSIANMAWQYRSRVALPIGAGYTMVCTATESVSYHDWYDHNYGGIQGVHGKV